MSRLPATSLILLTCIALFVSAMSGCARGARALSLSEPLARQACTDFLTAWKEGRKAGDLKPQIIGRDYAWDAGQQLLTFELLPEEVNDGTNLHIPVRLTLKAKDGRESDSEVTYVVGTSPVVTVIRE